MERRRRFLKITLGFLTSIGILFSPFFSVLRYAFAKTEKILLPKGTARETLIGENPADLDTRNLDPTPLERFGTMGLSDHWVDLEKWRLEIAGEVGKPLRLSYQEIASLPSIERNVLLICPGFFANHGIWKGVSIATLLRMAQAEKDVTHVMVHGPEGHNENRQRYPIEDIFSNKVFLAYQVNGKHLPQRHGFPLRTVAEGYYGYDWVKYVYKVTVERIQSPEQS
jgi:sulfoxide reductase catalytic subunit YedY